MGSHTEEGLTEVAAHTKVATQWPAALATFVQERVDSDREDRKVLYSRLAIVATVVMTAVGWFVLQALK